MLRPSQLLHGKDYLTFTLVIGEQNINEFENCFGGCDGGLVSYALLIVIATLCYSG